MRMLSKRERRLVAVGGLVAAAGLLWLGVIDPVLSGFDERAQARDKLALQYAHNEQTIAALPRLRRLARQSAGESKAFALSAATPDAAGQLLEERMRASVEAGGGEYRAGDHDGTTPDRIHAHAVVRMPVDKLVTWLERLQNQQPYCVVEQLGIGADAALASQKAENLDVKIEISIPFVRAASR